MAKRMTMPKADRIVRAVIYTRISVDRETQSSIENQMREIRDYCRLHNIEIVGEFSDVGKSAFKIEVERPGLESALEMIESGEANHIIVWKLDRLTRNARGFAQINDRIENADATFATVMEPWFDTSSPIGYAIVLLMAALAQMETENIKGRIISWHEGRRLNGDVPLGNTYGYDRPKKGDEGYEDGGALIVNKRERVIIEEITDRLLGGEGTRSIARDLTARGIPTPSGKTEWNHSSIRKMMLGTTIAGKYPDGSDCEGKWDAIVSDDKWRAMYEMLNDPVRAEQFGAARIPTHVLTNLMRCSIDGAEMNTFRGSKGRRYRCKVCRQTINAAIAESVLDEWIADNVSDARWRSIRASGTGRDESVVERLNEEIERLFVDYHSRAGKPGAIPAPVYQKLMDEKTAELEAATNGKRVKVPDVESLRDSWADLSVADKRLAIAATITAIEVAPLPKGQKPCPANARKRLVIR